MNPFESTRSIPAAGRLVSDDHIRPRASRVALTVPKSWEVSSIVPPPGSRVPVKVWGGGSAPPKTLPPRSTVALKVEATGSTESVICAEPVLLKVSLNQLPT